MDKELPVSAWPEWKIIEKIGEGSFGKVYKAQRTERGKFFYSAIKIINIPGSQSELNSLRSETGDDQAARPKTMTRDRMRARIFFISVPP